MINRDFFFSNTKALLFDGRFSQSQVDGLNAILNEWEKNYAAKDDRWLAYMLATTHHETGRAMKPIPEFGRGKGRAYGGRLKMNRTPYSDTTNIFYGRGFVQLTWYENYLKAGKEIGIDLINNPEKALELIPSTQIMFHGMMKGWFTGKKLSDYFNPQKEDWVNARRIINGLDKAQLVASYGRKYYSSISHTT
ncbi:MAG: hypothetical protein IPL53_16530 [Ignavibacteria bacterium]|nr:hypothetical protein [Ignavibacteria bacterium]